MKRSLFLWQFAGFTFTAVLGTLLHFVFDLTNIVWFAPFSAVNESTWEHMKILFFPMFLYAFFQCFFFYKDYRNFWSSKFIGIILGLITMPILFYTLSGVFGQTAGWVNVIIFFVSGGVAYLVEYYLLKNNLLNFKFQLLFSVLICLIALVFIIFTFYPPNIPLFLDPRYV